MSPHAAGRAARLQLGGVDQVTEQVRDVRVSRSSPAVAGDRCYADESRALDGVTQLARVGAGVRCLAPQRSGYIRRDRVEAAADGHVMSCPACSVRAATNLAPAPATTTRPACEGAGAVASGLPTDTGVSFPGVRVSPQPVAASRTRNVAHAAGNWPRINPWPSPRSSANLSRRPTRAPGRMQILHFITVSFKMDESREASQRSCERSFPWWPPADQAPGTSRRRAVRSPWDSRPRT